jgi:hypothetical protein
MPKGNFFADWSVNPQLVRVDFEEHVSLGDAGKAVNDIWFDCTNFIPAPANGYLIHPDIRRIRIVATPPADGSDIEGLFSIEAKGYLGQAPVPPETLVGVGLARMAGKYNDATTSDLSGVSVHKVVNNKISFKDFSVDQTLLDITFGEGMNPPSQTRYASPESAFRLLMHAGKIIPRQDGQVIGPYSSLQLNLKVEVWYARLVQEVVQSVCLAMTSDDPDIPFYKAPSTHNDIQAIKDPKIEATAMQKYNQGFDVNVTDTVSLSSIIQTVVGFAKKAMPIAESIISHLKTDQDSIVDGSNESSDSWDSWIKLQAVDSANASSSASRTPRSTKPSKKRRR